MLKQGSGVIINIASVAGLFGGRAGVVYNTSKHGLIGLTRSIAYAYACKGIRCNAIAPGAVMTSIGDTLRPHPFGRERMLPGTATLPRVNEPIEVDGTRRN